ncbi:MAG: Crp/Fnr family transcriptional regulator [Pseudomonadota bacterium]
MKKATPLSLEAKTAFFSRAVGFQGLSNAAYGELAALADTQLFVKDNIIFGPEEPCFSFDMVVEGLVRVSLYSQLGKRLTYLLAGPGEPLNLVGPFTGAPRKNTAEAVKDTILIRIKKQEFTHFAFTHPQLITNIIAILGQAVDSSNSRILDMVEKKVGLRLKRILYTLTEKFGPTLNFTAVEIAELSGTTPESILRLLAQLRENGVIEKSRGQIRVVDAKALLDPEIDAIWL